MVKIKPNNYCVCGAKDDKGAKRNYHYQNCPAHTITHMYKTFMKLKRECKLAKSGPPYQGIIFADAVEKLCDMGLKQLKSARK